MLLYGSVSFNIVVLATQKFFHGAHPEMKEDQV